MIRWIASAAKNSSLCLRFYRSHMRCCRVETDEYEEDGSLIISVDVPVATTTENDCEEDQSDTQWQECELEESDRPEVAKTSVKGVVVGRVSGASDGEDVEDDEDEDDDENDDMDEADGEDAVVDTLNDEDGDEEHNSIDEGAFFVLLCLMCVWCLFFLVEFFVCSLCADVQHVSALL
jgi:hypothetical protein